MLCTRFGRHQIYYMIGGQIYDVKLSSVTNTGNKMFY